MNSISTIILGTNATCAARTYYFTEAFAKKNPEGRIWTVIAELPKRGAQLTAVAFLCIPLVNIVFEKILRTIGCHNIGVANLAERVTITITPTMLQGSPEDKNDTYYLEIKVKPGTNIETTEPKDMSFVFCIDDSGSMEGSRIADVKSAMNLFLQKAQQKISQGLSTIQMSVIKFGDTAEIIKLNNQTQIKLGKDTSGLITQIGRALSTNSGTNIIEGLTLAANTLETMRKSNRAGATALVFLTDGDDQGVNPQKVRPIQNKLAAAGATLLALGISNSHDVKIMETITTDQRGPEATGSFSSIYKFISDQSTYGDKQGLTVEEAVQQIFTEISSQLVDSISCEPKGIARDQVTILNARPEKKKYHLGGVSATDTCLQKIARVVVPKGQGLPRNLGFQFSLAEGPSRAFVTKSVEISSDTSSTILTTAMKQEIIATLGICNDDKVKPTDKSARVKKTLQTLKQAGYSDENSCQSNDRDLVNLFGDLMSAKEQLDRGVQEIRRDFKSQERFSRMQRGRGDSETNADTLFD